LLSSGAMEPGGRAGHEARRARGSGGRALRSVLILFLLLVLLGGGAGGLYLWATGGSGPSRPVTVEVLKGATAADVGELLEERDVIRSSLAFRIAANLRGIGSEILAGTYQMRTNMTVVEALDVLEQGPPEETVEVTIPEGLEVPEVAAAVGDALEVDPETFAAAAGSGRFALPPYLPEGSPTVEGFLFPKTYGFDEKAPVDQVISRLLAQFETEATKLAWDRARPLGVSPYEAVIVASLIEREARIPSDRPKVAAVIYNRLERGMRLQIDATVQYAIPGGNRRLSFHDYEYPSPYNTYLHDGLPPTPIASPGLDSLRAALSPSDADYLFYLVVDEATGRHRFFQDEKEFCRVAPGC
jgi:UPF0755 protein